MATQWLSITGQPLNLDFEEGFLGSCTDISAYDKLNLLGEGTYGIVHRARSTSSTPLGDSKIIALKTLRIPSSERQNGLPITSLREISILRSLRHANIVNLLDVAVGRQDMDEVALVMDYCEQDLASLVDELGVRFSLSEVKCLARQLLEGLEYLHKNDIVHRDVKLQNILLTAQGVLKLADFGMARVYSPRPLTPGVVTIWYRAPEVLLGTKNYTPSVDLFSAALVIAELILNEPCLPGKNEIDQLSRTVQLLGSPTTDDLNALQALGCPRLIDWRKEGLPYGRPDNVERRFLDKSSPETVRFLRGLLRWDHSERWTAYEALGKGRSRYAAKADAWWKESPRAVEKDMLPTFREVRNEQSRPSETQPGGQNTSNERMPNANTSDFVFAFDGRGSEEVRLAKRRKR